MVGHMEGAAGRLQSTLEDQEKRRTAAEDKALRPQGAAS